MQWLQQMLTDLLSQMCELSWIVLLESSGGSRNLERGVQPLAHEAHSKIIWLPRPLPVH